MRLGARRKPGRENRANEPGGSGGGYWEWERDRQNRANEPRLGARPELPRPKTARTNQAQGGSSRRAPQNGANEPNDGRSGQGVPGTRRWSPGSTREERGTL